MKKVSLLLLFVFLHFFFGAEQASARAKVPAASKVKKVSISATRKRQKAGALKSRSSAKAKNKVRTKARFSAKSSLGRHKRLVSFHPRRMRATPSPPVLSAGDLAGLNETANPLGLESNAALVLDETTSSVLFAKNSEAVLPIASITKLMTALVVLEAKQDLNEVLTVTTADVDRIKYTSSRLPIGAKLTRREMLHIALMSSENRAASALGRHYPGGLPAFVDAMNARAKLLGMTNTHYVETTGLSSKNVSTPNDLARLVVAAREHPLIRTYSTHEAFSVEPGGRALQYRNSNRLVRNSNWDIVLQKTGYIAEAGRCLVMNAVIDGRSVVMIFLDSKGKYSRAADANRMRTWLENVKLPTLTRMEDKQEG
ncbi:D-alanyl-D-alanine endopeptidase [Herbaspirillum sp. GCM10030257]|uniref:D-alanyl-D-alanine endopeptidase n=1 Tax=Herbaspirillum sp. GCM10030257 TaxID=3273393 RepID=UPI00360F067A